VSAAVAAIEQEEARPQWRPLGDGSTWPLPCQGMDDLEWRLRYGGTNPNDRYAAASIIAAYRELIRVPRRRRELVVRRLKGAA